MKASLAHLDKFRCPHPQNLNMGVPTWGFFKLPTPEVCGIGREYHFVVMVSDAFEEIAWEHVSVHGRYFDLKGTPCYFTPSWTQMCWIKDQFWNEDECVMQLHVPKSEHVNTHNHVLHLWRPSNVAIPRPPQNLV